MHPADAFRVTDQALLLAQLAERPFCAVFASVRGRALVAHAPVVVRRLGETLALDFHVSRGNALAPHIAEGFDALAVSLGPEAYVSPDWYENPDQVPTWNYVSVEAEGRVMSLDDAGLVSLLDDLSAQEERRLLPKPAWIREKMSPGRFEAMTRAIVGARLTVRRLEGVSKLSQNKSEADRRGVAAALGDHPIARLMRAD